MSYSHHNMLSMCCIQSLSCVNHPCLTCNIYMKLNDESCKIVCEVVVTLEREVAICLLDCVRTNLRGPDPKFFSGGQSSQQTFHNATLLLHPRENPVGLTRLAGR